MYNQNIPSKETGTVVMDRVLYKLTRLIEKLSSGMVSEDLLHKLDQHLTHQHLIGYINGGPGDPLLVGLDESLQVDDPKVVKELQARTKTPNIRSVSKNWIKHFC